MNRPLLEQPMGKPCPLIFRIGDRGFTNGQAWKPTSPELHSSRVNKKQHVPDLNDGNTCSKPYMSMIGFIKDQGFNQFNLFFVNQPQGLGESFLPFFAGEHGERTGLGVFTEVGSAQMAGITPPSWNCSVALSLQGDSEKRRWEGTDDWISLAAFTTV